jgi:DNA-binding MarR family transcriptional regulator
MRQALVHSIRDFNRFYTAILGIVNNHILEGEYSLTEARIIYELAHSKDITAREIKEKLQIDEGYMSRIIARFVKNGILIKKQSKSDKRIYTLTLTANGKKISQLIDRQSDRQVENFVAHLDKEAQVKLVHLMAQVKELLKTT